VADDDQQRNRQPDSGSDRRFGRRSAHRISSNIARSKQTASRARGSVKECGEEPIAPVRVP
jgi:hypothetical protein